MTVRSDQQLRMCAGRLAILNDWGVQATGLTGTPAACCPLPQATTRCTPTRSRTAAFHSGWHRTAT